MRFYFILRKVRFIYIIINRKFIVLLQISKDPPHYMHVCLSGYHHMSSWCIYCIMYIISFQSHKSIQTTNHYHIYGYFLTNQKVRVISCSMKVWIHWIHKPFQVPFHEGLNFSHIRLMLILEDRFYSSIESSL